MLELRVQQDSPFVERLLTILTERFPELNAEQLLSLLDETREWISLANPEKHPLSYRGLPTVQFSFAGKPAFSHETSGMRLQRFRAWKAYQESLRESELSSFALHPFEAPTNVDLSVVTER